MLVGFEKYNRKNLFFTSIPHSYSATVIARAVLFSLAPPARAGVLETIPSQRHGDCFAAKVQERRLAMTAG